MVQQACARDGGGAHLPALNQVCLDYWYPLYAWARHSGRREADAQDLVQGFFEQLLQNDILQQADPKRGRLRSFLLICFKRHAQDVADKAHAAKRDTRKTLSLDFEWAEGRYHDHQVNAETPDALYDRRWAHTLLHYALTALAAEMASEGRELEFKVLQPWLGFQSEEQCGSSDAAIRLGISEGALKSRIFRFRKRFQEIVRELVTQTVGSDLPAKDELRELLVLV